MPPSAAAAGTAYGQRAVGPPGQATLPPLSVKVLGRLLSKPGALGEEHMDMAIENALARVQDMDGKDCVRVFRALVDRGRATPAAASDLEALGARLTERLPDISTKDMAEVADTLAEVSAPAAPVFARLSVAFSLRCAGASAGQLAKVAGAFARARLADRRLFPRMAQSAVRQAHLFRADLPTFLAAFAAVGICHEPLLTAASKVVVAQASRMSAMDLALVAYAYAQFYLVFPTVVAALSQRLPTCAHELPPARLAELCVSCARLDVRPAPLLATFARQLELRSMSPPLFGQVARSVGALGLGASALQEKLDLECRVRLSGLQDAALPSHEWLLDLLDGAGEAAEDARRRHGGRVPAFVRVALQAALPLSAICASLSATQAASLYRALRQLPPSCVAAPEVWALHAALAGRARELAELRAFGQQELTSALYSQLCLYPQLWEGGDATNPRWGELRASWLALREARAEAAAPEGTEDGDARTLRQDAVLRLLDARPPLRAEGAADAAARGTRPAALEVVEALAEAGLVAEGPRWVGPLEVQAVAGDLAVCLLPEAAFFRREGGAAGFQEDAAAAGAQLAGGAGLELCAERAAETALLRRLGWRAHGVAFSAWRRAPRERRAALLAEAFGIAPPAL